MKKLLLSMAVGAALAWLWDPDNGSRRRAMVRRWAEEKGVLSSEAAAARPLESDMPTAAPAAVASIR